MADLQMFPGNGRAEGLLLRDKRALVVGLGRSGAAAARLLSSRGARVTVTDIKGKDRLSAFLEVLPDEVELRLGSHRDDDFRKAELIVVSPGVPLGLRGLQVARSGGVPIVGEVELAFRYLKGHFVGITGSNGKTTTTTLLGEILRRAGVPVFVAGNIGRPLSEALLGPAPATHFVVELSSFQLESTALFRCDISAVLNLSPDHLDRYATLADYYDAKMRIFHNQRHSDQAVINRDDSTLLDRTGHLVPQKSYFSLDDPVEEGAFLSGDSLILASSGLHRPFLKKSQLRLLGRHNMANVLAAAAIADRLGIEEEHIAAAAADFTGVEHRLEYVATIDGAAYYNDSKATNVDSSLRAIESFQSDLLVILGGLDKGGDFAALRDTLRQRARMVIAFGSAAAKIESALRGALEVTIVPGLAEVVELASQSARPGDTVLFAPACASFDQFVNFEQRGRAFKEAVHRLEERAKESAL